MKRIDFKATDEIELSGILYEAKPQEKVIISIHGMSSNCFKKRETVIAKTAIENNISYFCFNNRGHDLVNYKVKEINGKKVKTIQGTTYEDILESDKDILGAIEKMIELGYKEIYLQGHSLGCTKIVYTYNKLKKENNKNIKNIKGIILLSLIDIPFAIKFYLNETFQKTLEYALQLKKQGKESEIMPKETFIHPISAKTFMRYAKENKEIDFVKYTDQNYEFKELQNIDTPIFMRWGNVNEMIVQDAQELSEMMNKKINNSKKDISYIDGANHGYEGEEEKLAKEIIGFIKEIM